MKKLILLLSFLISLKGVAQPDNWYQYPDGDDVRYHFAVQLLDGNGDPIGGAQHIYLTVDTSLFDILTDAVRIFSLREDFLSELAPTRIVSALPDGTLVLCDAAKIPITRDQIIDSLGYEPIETEVDPVFTGHVSSSITGTLISNWNTAFSWGNHATLYPLLSGSYSNPSWINSVAWSKITGAPAFLTAEVDGSITNEGSLTVAAGTGTTSIINSNTSGSTGVTLTAGTNVTISEVGNVITISSSSGGTVTSVSLTMPSAFNVSGSPVTTSGGFTVTGAGTASQFINGTGAISNFPATNNYVAYSAGTGYNITTTSAKIDFTGGGSIDPSITLGAAGTYIIMSNVRIDYSGLTNVAANTVEVKLRRTNNTATDLNSITTGSGIGNFIVPPVTLLTSTGGDCDISTAIYTTSNSNDVIEAWASRSGSISVGNIVAGNAWIVAYRIY